MAKTVFVETILLVRRVQDCAVDVCRVGKGEFADSKAMGRIDLQDYRADGFQRPLYTVEAANRDSMGE